MPALLRDMSEWITERKFICEFISVLTIFLVFGSALGSIVSIHFDLIQSEIGIL